jgi:AraC-like DNA-binding protein
MDENSVNLPAWLPELMEMVRAEFDNLGTQQLDGRPDLEVERDALRLNIQGWMQSLANPNLNSEVRNSLEAEWAAAEDRIQQIEQVFSKAEHRDDIAKQVLDESEVIKRLLALSDVLANNNPTRGNMELSLHIDRITCSPDGNVELRLCKLGSLPNVIQTLAEMKPNEDSQLLINIGQNPYQKNPRRTGPRRRGQLRITDDAGDTNAKEVANFIVDPNRFANLDEKWFWIDKFQIPVKLSWVEQNADAVMRRCQELETATGKPPSLNTLAREFGVSRPTIKTALDIATGKKPSREERSPEKRKFTAPLDEATRQTIVQLYHRQDVEQKEIGVRLDVHRSTVERVLNNYDEKRGIKRVDGRKRRSRKLSDDKEG